MARSIHVRLDDEADAALRTVRGGAMTDSEAVRAALREAALRRRKRSALAAEVAAVMADPADRREMAEVRELMDELAPATD